MSDTNIHRDYSGYTAEELLQDDFFISSMLQPAEDTERFWEQMLREEKINTDEYNLAVFFFNSVQVQPEPVFTHEIYELWEDIEVANKNNLRKRNRKFRFFYSAIAGAAAALVITFFLHPNVGVKRNSTASLQIENVKRPEANTKDIQLILSDNKAVLLEGKEASVAYDDKGISINEEKMNIEKENDGVSTTFNQLIVPLGKRSTLTFSEGTRIWVNAGTRVVYPVNFDSKRREIYVDGEAFLEVAHEKNRPFIVKTEKLDVEVLGTSFNVTAYEQDAEEHIVLVSGSVKVETKNEKEILLSPNKMFILSQNGDINIKSVDVNDYISWKAGLYQFNSEKLSIILKRLSRYYGKEIDCDEVAAELRCSGKLDLKEDLQVVLEGLSQTAPVNFSCQEGVYKFNFAN